MSCHTCCDGLGELAMGQMLMAHDFTPGVGWPNTCRLVGTQT